MDNVSFEKRKKVINDLIHDKMYVPMKAKEIAILLGISKEDRPALMEVLDALVLEGKIGVSKKGKYGKAENTAIVGTFESTQKGFGFVVIEDEPGQDIYIAEKDINGALHNDRVQVVITSEAKDGRRREGRIIKVIERGTLNIVGTYEKDGKYGFVIPDNLRFARDIYIASGHNKGAVTGHKVVVKLTSYGDDKHNPEGDVIDIIGHVDDPGTDIMSIVLGYDIPTEFPQEVTDSLNDIPDSVAAEDIEGRKDCRDWQTVTIVRWEQNMMRSLLSPGEKKDYFIKFNVDGLLRGDYQSRITRCLGGRWNHQRIKDLLSNEKYLGNALLQKKYRNNHLEKKLVKNEGDLAQYYAEGTHDAIIDEETFAKAQEIIRNIEKKREGCKKPELCAFSGMIICSDCGAKYKRTTNKGKHSWQCTTFLTKGKIFCPSKQIPEEEVYRAATEALKLDEFDSLIFQDKIKNIIAEDNYIFTFCFKDETEISEKWISRSRKNSWTDEMRECARQRVLKQRGRT